MVKEETLRKMKYTIECLYQNKEKEALTMISEWMLFFKDMAEVQAERKDGSVLHIIRFLNNLIENYNCRDMLGMADCLQENAWDLIELYAVE